jgi:hypothetical protein
VWLCDLSCSGHPVMSVSPEMLPCSDAIVCLNYCITT